MKKRFTKRSGIYDEVNKKWVIILLSVITFLFIIFTIISINYAVNQVEKDNFIEENSSKSSSVDISSSENTPPIEAPFIATVQEGDPVESGYFTDAYFIGDSITVGLGNYSIINQDNIVADIGLNLQTIDTKKIINSPEGLVSALKSLQFRDPKKIYVMLGSNGISWQPLALMVDKYSAFIDQIKAQHPLADIYISAIPPVTNAKQKSDVRFANSKIDEYNLLLLNIAKEKKVYYLNSCSILKDEYGNLIDSYAEKDGMHMKKEAYQALFEYYSKHTKRE